MKTWWKYKTTVTRASVNPCDAHSISYSLEHPLQFILRDFHADYIIIISTIPLLYQTRNTGLQVGSLKFAFKFGRDAQLSYDDIIVPVPHLSGSPPAGVRFGSVWDCQCRDSWLVARGSTWGGLADGDHRLTSPAPAAVPLCHSGCAPSHTHHTPRCQIHCQSRSRWGHHHDSCPSPQLSDSSWPGSATGNASVQGSVGFKIDNQTSRNYFVTVICVSYTTLVTIALKAQWKVLFVTSITVWFIAQQRPGWTA